MWFQVVIEPDMEMQYGIPVSNPPQKYGPDSDQ